MIKEKFYTEEIKPIINSIWELYIIYIALKEISILPSSTLVIYFFIECAISGGRHESLLINNLHLILSPFFAQ